MRVVAGVAAFSLVALSASLAWGHGNGWIGAGEAGLDSNDAIEEASTKPDQPNLCEGINGIPFGADPGWVRTNGSPDPNTPFVEIQGQVLPDLSYKTNPFVTHTDAPFNHYSHDLDVFVTLDKPYRNVLASGNFEYTQDVDDSVGVENEHAMIELEWERSGLPSFAYPSQADRIAAWGPLVWDCGHGEAHVEDMGTLDPSDDIFHPNTFRTEIHSPVGWVAFRNTAAKSDRDQAPPAGKAGQDPWVWYEGSDHQGVATTLPSTPLKNTPVQATVADAFFSTFGGNIPESINGCDDSTFIADDTVDAACLSHPDLNDNFEWAQPLLNQDYTFFVPAPPKPSDGSTMVWESVDRCGEVPHSPGNPPGDDAEDVSEADDTAENIGAPTCNIPDSVVETTKNGQPGILVTVKAESSDATYPASDYVAFARTYKVAWDEAKPERPRVFDVAFDTLQVIDDTEDQGNDGEWVVSATANERWVHPVVGSGDDGEPFYDDGALDDGCEDEEDDPEEPCNYSIGVNFDGIGIVPNETLNVKFRGWDDDTTFIQDNDVNEILPVVNVFHPLSELPGSFDVDAQHLPFLGSDGRDGDYDVKYSVTETTPTPPTLGTLDIGDPKYGPNADTGGTATRISGSTPLTFTGSDGAELQYRFWKDGTDKPKTWHTDSSGPFDVALSGAGDGRYTIEYRPVSTGGVVGTPKFAYVELDTTPPALTVPADIEVFATQTEGAYVNYTFSASDNLPGPVEASCTPVSGSLFPNGKNAPLITVVTCTATDAVGNTATKTFNVTVTSPFGYLDDFVVLGEDWARLGTGVQVQSGNVGAFQSSAGIANRPGVEVEVGTGSVLTGGSQVAAESVALANSVTAGDVFVVDSLTVGAGAVFTQKAGYVPLFLGMPAFPLFSGAGLDLDLNGTQPLPPGTYGDVTVGPNADVTLTGGNYYLTGLEVKPGGKLRAVSPSTLHVTGRALIGNNATFGPAPGSAVTPHDIVLYGNGTDGPPKNPKQAIRFGNKSIIGANAFAKQGTLAIGSDAVATGAFIGRRVDVGTKAVLNRDSVFLVP